MLDIRTDEDRAQWAIPGSVHVNAYEALRAGQPGALASDVPADRPVVTVCNAGRVSQTAAEILANRGFDARSLAGGMKAWSLAWNTADVPLADARSKSSRCAVPARDASHTSLAPRGGRGDRSVGLADVYLSSPPSRIDDSIRAGDARPRRPPVAREGPGQGVGATLLLPAQHRVQFPFRPVPMANASLGDATSRYSIPLATRTRAHHTS